MAKLTFSSIISLDGYAVDDSGSFGWAEPGEDVIAWFARDLESVGTHLLGRRMYEVMHVWETDPGSVTEGSPASVHFAEGWQAAEKIVFSSTLTEAVTQRTRIEPAFDPDAVAQILADAERDVIIEGPTLAAHALRAGLVDEIRCFLVPAIIGGGTRMLPEGVRLDLELISEERFDRGILGVRYAVRR